MSIIQYSAKVIFLIIFGFYRSNLQMFLLQTASSHLKMLSCILLVMVTRLQLHALVSGGS